MSATSLKYFSVEMPFGDARVYFKTLDVNKNKKLKDFLDTMSIWKGTDDSMTIDDNGVGLITINNSWEIQRTIVPEVEALIEKVFNYTSEESWKKFINYCIEGIQ